MAAASPDMRFSVADEGLPLPLFGGPRTFETSARAALRIEAEPVQGTRGRTDEPALQEIDVLAGPYVFARLVCHGQKPPSPGGFYSKKPARSSFRTTLSLRLIFAATLSAPMAKSLRESGVSAL